MQKKKKKMPYPFDCGMYIYGPREAYVTRYFNIQI